MEQERIKMAERRFFWLKLKEDFFDEKQVKYLRKLPDGDKLTIVYLKMLLKSIRTEGVLKYDQILPSCEAELAMILDEDENIIRLLINALQQMGLVDVIDNGSLYMTAIKDLTGSEGTSAERMRKLREKKKKNNLLPSQCDAPVTRQLRRERARARYRERARYRDR